MTFRNPILAALLLVALCVLATGPVRAQATEAVDAPVRVAVVDMLKVLEAYKKREDLGAEVDRRKATVRGHMEEAVKQASEIDKQMNADPRPDNYDQLRARRDELLRTSKKDILKEQLELQRLEKRYEDEVLDDIGFVVGMMARKQNIDLVLRVAEGDRPNVMALGLVWGNEKTDLTAEVIRRLNERYKQEKQKEKKTD